MAVRELRVLATACALAAFVGCGRVPLDLGDDGSARSGTAGQGGSAGQGAAGHGGAGGSSATCQGLDKAACAATPGCTGQLCPSCGLFPDFTACYRTGDPPPVCIAPSCPALPCEGLDESSCKGTSGCSSQHCPDCKGGQVFVGCYGPGEGAACVLGCPAPASCAGLDEMACIARSDCHPGYCGCPGEQMFTVCLGPNEAAACPAYACPAAPAACIGLNEAVCNSRGDCQAEYCNTCLGRTFAGCGNPGTGFSCPAVGACVMPVPCARIADQLSCDARTDCHSVFGDPGTCDCATAGCCIGYSRCADGGKAACSGPTGPGILCMAPPPACGGAYVISFTADCWEGCVRPTECAIPARLGLQ
jgi:hypothetical protein